MQKLWYLRFEIERKTMIFAKGKRFVINVLWTNFKESKYLRMQVAAYDDNLFGQRICQQSLAIRSKTWSLVSHAKKKTARNTPCQNMPSPERYREQSFESSARIQEGKVPTPIYGTVQLCIASNALCS